MIVYAVQWHRAPLPSHLDESDLEWTTWAGHDDYLEEVEAHEAASEFDAAFDGAYVHRVVARRVASPTVAKTVERAVSASAGAESLVAATLEERRRMPRPA